MHVTETNADGLKREFKVVVPAGHMETLVNTRLEEVGRTAKIPGFRPGKVPFNFLKKKYGPSVMGEVLENAVNEGTQKAIVDNDLRPAVQPKVEIVSYEEGGDLEFKVDIETLPEIELMDFGALEIERPTAEVPEAEVTTAIERIAERRASSEPVAEDRPAAAGDTVVIDFLGKKDNVPFEGGAGQDYSLTLGSNTFIPGFEDQLIGVKAGSDVVVKVTFPEEYGSEELAGADAEFDVKVKELRQSVPTPIDDELAKSVGLEDLEGLKTAIRGEISREYDTVSRARVKRDLLDMLAEKQVFAVPESMVTMEFDHIWQQLEKAKQEDKLDEADKGKSDDELKADYKTIAERRVRLGLILSEVGRKNEITVNQDDINKAVMEEARRFPGQEHMVFQYYTQNQDAINSLRAPIFEDKVIDYIVERAKVTDKVMSPEELMKDPDEAGTEGAEDAGAESKPKKKAAKKKAESE